MKRLNSVYLVLYKKQELMKFEVSPVSSFGLIIFNLKKNLLKKFIKEEKVTKWNFRHTLVPLAAMEVIFLLLQFS